MFGEEEEYELQKLHVSLWKLPENYKDLVQHADSFVIQKSRKCEEVYGMSIN